MQLNGRELEASNMRDLFLARVGLGEKPLLICDGETLSYAHAHELSNRVASSIARNWAYRQGDVVATFMYNSVDHADDLAGLHQTGSGVRFAERIADTR